MSKGGIRIHLPGTAFEPGDRVRISGSMGRDGLYTIQRPHRPSMIRRLRTWINGITDRIRNLFRRRQRLQWIHSKKLDRMLIKHQREIHGQMLVFTKPKDHPNPVRIVIAAQAMLNQYGLS